jgi:hypothetical protein
VYVLLNSLLRYCRIMAVNLEVAIVLLTLAEHAVLGSIISCFCDVSGFVSNFNYKSLFLLLFLIFIESVITQYQHSSADTLSSA